jgi:hypothetical protein
VAQMDDLATCVDVQPPIVVVLTTRSEPSLSSTQTHSQLCLLQDKQVAPWVFG